MEQEMSRRTLRLPQDVSEFVREQAYKRRSSINSEIINALRERMAATGDSFAGTAPAAASDRTALAGGPINQR